MHRANKYVHKQSNNVKHSEKPFNSALITYKCYIYYIKQQCSTILCYILPKHIITNIINNKKNNYNGK